MEKLKGLPFKFSESMAGTVTENPSGPQGLPGGTIKSSKDIKVDITIQIDDLGAFLENPDHSGGVIGAVTLGGKQSEIRNGRFKLFNKDEKGVRHLEYAFEFSREDGQYKFLGIKNIKDDPGLDMLSDVTTLFVSMEAPDAIVWSGHMHFKVCDFISLVASMQAPEGAPPEERILAKTAFLSSCFGQITDEYLMKKFEI